MSYELKVKALSLMAEAKIIRRLERKYKRAKARAASEQHKAEHRAVHMDLRAHRKGFSDVARNTHLARMFLKGRPLIAAEPYGKRLDRGTDQERIRRSWPDWKAIQHMAQKYGPPGRDYDNEFAAWMEDGKAAAKTNDAARLEQLKSIVAPVDGSEPLA